MAVHKVLAATDFVRMKQPCLYMGVGGLGSGVASLNCSKNYGNWYKPGF